jgi:hypothetical protein
MTMGTLDAINAIGTAFIELTDRRDYQHRKFPFPSVEQFSPDKPSFLVRWEGIAADEPTENEMILTPSMMRFAVRIINIYSYGAPGVQDPYAQAQNNITSASAKFHDTLSQNRHLNELVLDTGVESSVVGDLVDPTTEEVFYGHEALLVVKLW